VALRADLSVDAAPGDVRNAPRAGLSILDRHTVKLRRVGDPASPFDQDGDDILMARVADGDPIAYRVLARRHVRRALAVAQRIVGNASDAEELVQEALLRVWLHAHRWQPERAGFTTWFYRILTNLCLDLARRPTMPALDGVPEPVDPAPGPFAQAEGRQIARAISQALAALPASQRVAVTLCYYEDMSCADAAKILAVSVSAMEALLVRGRRALRAQLSSLARDVSESTQ